MRIGAWIQTLKKVQLQCLLAGSFYATYGNKPNETASKKNERWKLNKHWTIFEDDFHSSAKNFWGN